MIGKTLRLGIFGDFNPANPTHITTNQAIEHAAAAASHTVEVTWLPTPHLESVDLDAALDGFDGLWCSPGSPYASMQGALRGIRWARERGKPFIGT